MRKSAQNVEKNGKHSCRRKLRKCCHVHGCCRCFLVKSYYCNLRTQGPRPEPLSHGPRLEKPLLETPRTDGRLSAQWKTTRSITSSIPGMEPLSDFREALCSHSYEAQKDCAHTHTHSYCLGMNFPTAQEICYTGFLPRMIVCKKGASMRCFL